MKIILSFLFAGALLSAGVTPSTKVTDFTSTICQPNGAPITVNTKYDTPTNTDSKPGIECPVVKIDCKKGGGDGPSNPTPEPASYALFGAGALAFGAFRKFQKKS
jgi:hypothetical protein